MGVEVLIPGTVVHTGPQNEVAGRVCTLHPLMEFIFPSPYCFDFFVSSAAGAGFDMGTERELGSGVGLIAWRRLKGD